MFLKNNYRLLFIYGFFLFLIATSYGLIIRWNFTFPISSFPYQNTVQSHSHVAFLGWGYLIVIGAIINLFINNAITNKRAYNYSLGIIAISVTLMLISFPLSGYKVFSIALLAIFGLTSYVLSYRLLKDLKGTGTAIKFIRFGVYYYLLSSLATWFLAGVVITQGKTDLYYNTVYFYLHFLYNGFFVFALFGLLLKLMENEQITIPGGLLKGFFVYLNIACIPAYALSVLWSGVGSAFYVIGFAASILQFISLLFLILIIRKVLPQIKWDSISRLLLKFSFIAYSLKVVLQVASAFPYFVVKSLALKPFFIIGYLHLFTLAFMSVLLLFILNKMAKNKLISTIISKIGVVIFLVGVFFTELLLFLQGFLLLIRSNIIENYNLWLLLFSFLMLVGLIFLFINKRFLYLRTWK